MTNVPSLPRSIVPRPSVVEPRLRFVINYLHTCKAIHAGCGTGLIWFLHSFEGPTEHNFGRFAEYCTGLSNASCRGILLADRLV